MKLCLYKVACVYKTSFHESGRIYCFLFVVQNFTVFADCFVTAIVFCKWLQPSVSKICSGTGSHEAFRE